jgi:hypothetical protein
VQRFHYPENIFLLEQVKEGFIEHGASTSFHNRCRCADGLERPYSFSVAIFRCK